MRAVVGFGGCTVQGLLASGIRSGSLEESQVLLG